MSLSRDRIREEVFARDNHRCVFCGAPAEDAHHLLERRLWEEDEDFGYLLDNLISVCEHCHILCERTIISVEEGRTAAAIANVRVPRHLYADQPYDKWGNPILESGSRIMGELFSDESVQRALKAGNRLDRFVPYMKYPRTSHFPWSFGHDDDIFFTHSADLLDCEVVITEKLDGECTSMYNDKIHARAVDGRFHPSQSWVRNFWSKIAHDLPYGTRVCGENVFARHSLNYTNLDTYFYGFSVWEFDRCLAWDETIEWFQLLDITPVPVLYRGQFSMDIFDSLRLDETTQEGYVLRVADEFSYKDFQKKSAKYVRKGHLQTKARWDGRVERNHLKNEGGA